MSEDNISVVNDHDGERYIALTSSNGLCLWAHSVYGSVGISEGRAPEKGRWAYGRIRSDATIIRLTPEEVDKWLDYGFKLIDDRAKRNELEAESGKLRMRLADIEKELSTLS